MSAKLSLSQSQARDLLWEKGDLSWKFHSGQKLLDKTFTEAQNAFIAFNVARQFGKTTFAVIKAVEAALTIPNAKVKYAAPFETDLVEFVQSAFEWVLQDCPNPIRPQWNSHRKTYTFKNGSMIRLLGLDKKLNSLRGNVIDLLVIDESGFVSKLDYIYAYVVLPCLTHRPDAKILMISTPPESVDHQFWVFCDRARKEKAYAEFTIDENPMLSKEDIARIEKEMGGRGSTAFKREYLCQRVTETSRSIIPDFKDTHVVETPKPPEFEHLHKYVALDPGVRDQTVSLVAWYDFKRAVVVVEDERVLQGEEVDTRNIARDVRRMEILHFGELPVYRRIADNSDPILLADLSREFNVHFTPTKKDTLEAMVNNLRLFFSDNRIEINPRCLHLIGTLRAGLWNKTRTEFGRSVMYGHCDAIAALMYLVRNVDRLTNPVPTTFGLDTFNTFFPKQNQPLSPAAKALKEAFRIK